MSEAQTDSDLKDEIRALREEVAQMNNNRIVRIHNNLWRLAWVQFVRGIMLGLGTVFGTTLVLSILIFSLSQIEFVPYLGDLATEILHEIEAARQPR